METSSVSAPLQHSLPTLERRVLRMLARGADLPSILQALCSAVEAAVPESFCSILLVDNQARVLRHGAGYSLPQSFADALDGRPLDPAAGPCALSVRLREPVIVADVAADERWRGSDWQAEAMQAGLRAGWSSPIQVSSGEVVGTFAVYWPKTVWPAERLRTVIADVTDLTAVAIELKRAEGQLLEAADARRASAQLARGQLAALTRTLETLAEEEDADKLFEHVLRIVTSELNAHSSGVWLRVGETDDMAYAGGMYRDNYYTPADSFPNPADRMATLDDVWSWRTVMTTGRPCVMEDIRSGPDFRHRQRVVDDGVVTILVLPLIVSARFQGLIGIRFDTCRQLLPEEIDLAQALANQAMLAMRLTELSEHSRASAIVAERNRLARDIHDTLAQGITGIIVQLEAAEDAMCKGLVGESLEHQRRARELARDSLGEARRSVRALRPRALEEGDLAMALTDLMHRMTVGTTVRANLQVVGEWVSLPAEWETNLLRIGQELLTNTLKHGQATQFGAALECGDGEVRLTTWDDGSGFDPQVVHDGFGLTGIGERVLAMDGRLHIVSAPGRGVRVVIELKRPGMADQAS